MTSVVQDGLIKDSNNGNVLPDNSTIDEYHPHLAKSLIKNFSERNFGKLTSDRRMEIARSLNLDVEFELIHNDKWTLERTLFEVREFVNNMGKPGLMPMQKDFIAHGRQDIKGAVGRYGGQSKVASMLGLTYQGQIVAPDGSRTYWTEERIGEFLHEVAAKEGHPSVMPTRREVINHADNPVTVINIITKAAYPNQKTLTWYELAREHGLQYQKDSHMVTKSFIKAFVESLGDALYHLTPAEIFVLFEQQGITKVGSRKHDNRSFDNLVDAIQSGYLPKEEVEKWLNGDEGDLVEALLDKNIHTVEEAFKSVGATLGRQSHKRKDDNPNDEPYREDVENNLPIPSVGDSLDSLKISTDLLNQLSSDQEAVEFLIAKAADKLWKRCFYDEESAVLEARNHKGNVYSEKARDTFIEEYTRCRQLPLPEGYAFTDPKGIKRKPKLMQRLIAYRVLTKNRVLNLSGTGTGKTLSAILASRVIGARLTIITCPNATVEAWQNNILNAFPESDVITKPTNWELKWINNDKPRYLVVNHEMLQNKNESSIKKFINANPYDLIVIDELHQVKQRDADSETQRRRLLTGLITDIPEDRPKPRVLGMSATPIINNLQEGRSLVELVTSLVHEDIGTKPSIPNCMRMYQRFTALGFRMMPKSDVSREPHIYPVDATPLLGELVSLGARPHPQQVDAVLVKAKWPIIKQHLKEKTVIFTEYVSDIVSELASLIESEGFTVGIYTGSEKLATELDYHNSLQQFISGGTDILLASIRTLATGVDGLQYVSNNVIFATLPWTSTDFDQAIGRFDREGFAFSELNIHIPKTYAILSTGAEWSWCESKLRRLENKRDIARAAVDGEIPDKESQLTPAKATQYWMGWLNRLNEEGIYEINRRSIKVPLDESNESEGKARYAKYGDFSKLNNVWNNAHSSVTHARLKSNPEEWCFYHTRLLEQEKEWQVVPREQCVVHLKENLPKGSVVGDFGCGLGKLAEALKDWHLVHSFDHVALSPGIIECDISSTPLDDSCLDAVIFSLSLMGRNHMDYVAEAYRTLKLSGQILIWQPATQSFGDDFVLKLKDQGFAIVEDGQIYKWRRIWAIKQAKH